MYAKERPLESLETIMILDDKLARGDTIVLDGAIGSEIDRLGGKMHPVAWCGVPSGTGRPRKG